MRLAFLAMFFAVSFSFCNGIEIHSRLANGNLFSNEMGLHLRIYNNTNEKLDLSKASLIYRFSDASSLDKFAYDIWWFSNGNTSDAKISFHGIGSDEKFFKLYFIGGEVASGSYAEIQFRVRKTDWSPFSMFNDYSLPLSGTGWSANPNIAFSASSLDSPLLPPAGEQNSNIGHFSDMLLDLSDYSVFGTNETRLADRVSENSGRIEIHGSVGTGNYVEIGADSKITGNLHSRKNAFLRERAQLLGDLRVGENYVVQNSVLIGGEKITSKPIPDFKLSNENDLRIGTADIFIGNHESRHLEPGAYKDLTAYSNSELCLKPGKYTFRNFRLEPEAKLKLNLSNGAIEINATEMVTFSDRIAVSFTDGYANPLAFRVYQHGSQDLRIGTDLSIGGHFIAPNAAIRVSSRVKLAGWLHGKNIYIEPDTKICEPPTLVGLSHSKIAYGPDFNALNQEYRTAYKADGLEVFAKAKDKNSTVDIYRDGNKFKVRLYNSEKASIHSWCAQTEYSLVTGDGKNTAVYVKGNLQKGLETAKAEGKAIWLTEGSYGVSKDSVLKIGMGTEIHGSFAEGGSLENRGGDINKTIINGNGENTLLFLGGSGLPYTAYLDMATVTNGNILSVSAAPILDYLVVNGNDIKAEGGGIYSINSDGLKITNSYIVNNRSALGGALYVDKGSLFLENSIISSNKANSGAAIYAENAKLKIRHTAIADNLAQAGKGIAFSSNVNVETANNIVWGNGGTDLAATAQNPLFKSNIAAGEDGLFFTKDDGYALSDNSPMIDKGTKQEDIPIDIFQIDRTISKDGSGLPDMGAREWFPDLKNNFKFLKRMVTGEWIPVEKPTILAESVGEYFPLKRRNSPYTYNLSVKAPRNKYMKDKHEAYLRILDENGNTCGETKKIAFYRIGEENGMVEYRTYRAGATYKDGVGQFVFLSKKEMPSYDWYQVVKVCEQPRFKMEIEVVK